MNCKPGDSAFCINLCTDSVRGKICKVIRRDLTVDGDWWHVEFDHPQDRVYWDGSRFVHTRRSRKSRMHDLDLKPINPPAIDQTTEADELVKA